MKAKVENVQEFKARLRAHHESIARGLDRYGAMTRAEKERACQLVTARTGSKVMRVEEILAAHEELRQLGNQLPYVCDCCAKRPNCITECKDLRGVA